MPALKDLTDREYGRLTAKRDSGDRANGSVVWECQCSCGNICFIASNSLIQNLTKSCGCYNKSSESKYSGEDHWNWQGGIARERDRVKITLRYKEWRAAVFERDDYTCQKCGRRGITINAHHIESFSGNPELRTELNNGVALCTDCHNEFHHIYGHDCTRDQWNKFLNNKES